MKRFEIRRNKERSSQTRNPFLVVLQAGALHLMGSVIVAPLEATHLRPGIKDIDLPFEVEGQLFWMALHELSAVPKQELGAVVADAAALEWEIARALDVLLFGV